MVKRHRKLIVGLVIGLLVGGVGLLNLRAGKRTRSTPDDSVGATSQATVHQVRDPLDPASLTPLMLAALNGDIQTVKTLLAKGTAVDETNVEGMVPLMCAAARGHADVLQLLITAGSQVNRSNSLEQTALIFAAKYGHVPAAKLLIASGADVNAQRHRSLSVQTLEDIYGENGEKDNQEARSREWKSVALVNAFGEALISSHPDIAKLLLENGATPMVTGTDGANEALQFAARQGYAELVVPLIEKGADVNHQGWRGRTPLLEAARGGRAAVVALLLSRGAAVDIRDNQGQTALLLAVQTGNLKSVESLLAHNPQLEVTDLNGRTVLMIASEHGELPIVSALLKSGANKDAKDSAGKTAGMRAEYYGHADIAKKLGVKSTETGTWPN